MICSKCGHTLDNNVCQNCSRQKERKLLIIIIGILSVIICCCLLFFSTSNGNGRVIMMYMVGSNLEKEMGLATQDIEGIDYDSITKNNTKVVILAGGTETWKNNYFDTKSINIYELTKDGYKKVNSTIDTNMGETQTLSNFLNYVYDNYKSDKYSLIFWDHGSAVGGAIVDDYTEDLLSLKDMSEGLKNSPFNSKNKLENVIFRTCLNGTIEVANVFKNYADYLIASEEITYGSSRGGSTLSYINNIKMSDNGKTIGEKFVDNYKQTVSNYCNSMFNRGQDNYCSDIAYAVIDLSKIDKLNSNINNLFKKLNSDLSNNFNVTSKVRANLTQYAKDQGNYFEMVDLYTFISEIGKETNTNVNDVLKSIKNCIVYFYTNTNYSNGLSVYFPYHNEYYLPIYYTFDYSKEYYNYITKFTTLKKNYNVSPFSLVNNQSFVNKIDKESYDFELNLTNDQVKNVSTVKFYLLAKDPDGYVPLLITSDVQIENNYLKVKVKDKVFRVAKKDESDWVWMKLTKVDDNAYKINVKLYNGLSESLFGEAILKYEGNDMAYISSIVVQDVIDSGGSHAVNGMQVKIDDYKYINFFNGVYKINSDDLNKNVGDFTNVMLYLDVSTSDYKFIKEKFDSSNEYYGLFKIYDVQGNSYNSKLIKMN